MTAPTISVEEGISFSQTYAMAATKGAFRDSNSSVRLGPPRRRHSIIARLPKTIPKQELAVNEGQNCHVTVDQFPKTLQKAANMAEQASSWMRVNSNAPSCFAGL